MTKVLTYHKSQNGGHWFKSVAYGKNEIEAIKDPQGGDTEYAPTSIPSPFARFDLVRTAFANLSQNASLKGSPNDSRLVSEALDLGEILFNYEDFKNQLKIVDWSKQDLANLLKSSSQSHQRLGKALNLYLTQDAEAYNFNHIQRLFVVFFKGVAIGGTSPSTLFFSSANSLKHLSVPLGNQHLFDGNPCPLYKRDIEYQKMWYCLQQLHGFKDRFIEINAYLDNSLKLLKLESPALYHKHISTENGDSLIQDYYVNKFEELTTGIKNNFLEVIGFPLRKKRISLGDIEHTSGFAIKTSRYKSLYPNLPVPLALQDKFRKIIPYTQYSSWNPDVSVPAYHQEDWRQNLRKLPGQSTNYPWLTISDFLEPYLIRVSYPINTDAYFFGKIENLPENKGYMLPLKKDFFDFFGIDDLQKGIVKLTMEGQGGGGVRVSLQIPIESRNGGFQEYISLDRTYIPLANSVDVPIPNLINNEGFIIDQKFTVNIYPMVRSGEFKLNADYRIQLIEQKSQNEDIKINFIDFANNVPIVPESERYRSPRTNDLYSSKYYILKKEFDYLAIQFDNPKTQLNAILLPKWVKYNGKGKKFSFAVDFGTSNTHIEYKVDNAAPKKFSVEKVQIGTLVKSDKYNERMADYRLFFPLRTEFLPINIGTSDAEDTFPIRTAISFPINININRPTYTLADYNIPFYYEKQASTPKGDDLSINLKWAKDDEASRKKVMAFFEELIMLIRNKVIFEGGDLEETKLYWFYPSSMQKSRIKNLKKIWDDMFHLHISGKKDYSPLPVSESIAPFYHYKEERPSLLASEKPVISIDIGGGTTDVVVYENNSPTLLTSFRFAGNAIYGDVFTDRASASNGFVFKYKTKIESLLKSNHLDGLLGCYNQTMDSKKSEEIISLWFAIEKSATVKNKEDLSFNRMLAQDDDLKIVFVFFYTAILYHVAKLLKSKGIEMPKSITFSGTGSKMINIITNDDEQLRDLTKVIFEKIFEKSYSKNDPLEVFCDRDMPKEATCKGVLVMEEDDLKINPQDITEVYTASYQDTYSNLTYEDLSKNEVKESILKEVESFIDFFFSLNRTYDFDDELGVNPEYTKLAKETLKENLSAYLTEGITMKKRGLMIEDKDLEETLFFYPLIGAINRLAFKIGSKSKLS